MRSRANRVWRRLTGRAELPEGFSGELAAAERVLGSAEVAGGGQLVVTSLGLWTPEGDATRQIGWHLISTARWDGRALSVTEADEVGTLSMLGSAEARTREGFEPAGGSSAGAVAVLLVDRPPRLFALPAPGTVPQLVQARVTRSVLASERRELPGGSAVFVRRHIPGRDGVLVQIRPDPGTDVEAVKRAGSHTTTPDTE